MLKIKDKIPNFSQPMFQKFHPFFQALYQQWKPVLKPNLQYALGIIHQFIDKQALIRIIQRPISWNPGSKGRQALDGIQGQRPVREFEGQRPSDAEDFSKFE